MIIGFERSYTVNEADGMVEVCAAVVFPSTEEELFVEVTLTVATIPGTAGKLNVM